MSQLGQQWTTLSRNRGPFAQRLWFLAFACCCTISLLTGACMGEANAAEPLTEMLKWVPAESNAVVVIRGREILATPRAKAGGWRENASPVSVGTGLELPLDAEVMLKAIDFVPGHAAATRRLGLAWLGRRPAWDGIAKRAGVSVDHLASKPLVTIPTGGGLVGVTSEIYAAVNPLNRQQVGRWLRQHSSVTAPICAPYLQQQVQQSKSHILVALDLQDLFEPVRTESWLAAAPFMIEHADQTKGVTALLRSATGLVVEMNFTDVNELVVRFDFSTTVPPAHAPLVQAAFVELVGEAGAHLDELAEAKLQRGGNSVTLTATLSEESTRALLGMILAPRSEKLLTESGSASESGTGTPARVEPDETALRARRYFNAVNRLVDDALNRGARSNNYHRTAAWHESAANSIDQLELTGLPEPLLQYGATSAEQLRAMAASLRGVPIEVNALQNAIRVDYSVRPWEAGWGLWGGNFRPAEFNVQTNAAEIRAAQARAVAAGAQQRDELRQMMARSRQQVRRDVLSLLQTDLGAEEVKSP